MSKSTLENQMFIIPIDDIFIGDRAREELGDIESLQNSIERIGQLTPIILKKENNELVGGFRRLTCHRNLGLKTIKAVYREDLSPIMQKVIEHDENLHEQLTWSETAKLRYEIHNMLQKEHGKPVKGHHSGGWTQEDTAKFLGISVGALSQDLALMESMKAAPELGQLTSKNQAMKTVNKMHEIAILTEIAKRDAEDNTISSKDIPYQLFEGDSIETVRRKIADEIVDLIIFDPPWGIDADIIASSRGPRGEKTFYDDSSETSQNLTFELVPELYRVLKKGSHMYMFCGTQYAMFYANYLMNQRQIVIPSDWAKTLDLPKGAEQNQGFFEFFVPFEKGREWQFDVRIIPLIWVKEGGGFTDFEYKFMPRYEAILFATKGVRRLNYPVSDVFEYARPASTARIHPQQKPIELIQELIKISTVPNAIVLDPCAGSGVTAVAATLAKRRSIVIEKDHEAFLRMRAWVQAYEEVEDA